MKFIYCLLLSTLITSTLNSQICKPPYYQSFFKSIQFGKPLPKDIVACSNHPILHYSYYSNLYLVYDSLNKNCKKRYSDLFTFLSTPFKFVEVYTNRRGLFSGIDMFSFLNDDRKDSTDYAPPANFTSIYNKLVPLYGKPTSTKDANHDDTVLIKDLGMPLLVEWFCDDIILQLRVRYGARQKDLNGLGINIVYRDFEIEEIRSAD